MLNYKYIPQANSEEEQNKSVILVEEINIDN